MQMIFIGAALLVAAALSFWAITVFGKFALNKWDAWEIQMRARKAEREIERRHAAMRRYSMEDFRGARKP